MMMNVEENRWYKEERRGKRHLIAEVAPSNLASNPLTSNPMTFHFTKSHIFLLTQFILYLTVKPDIYFLFQSFLEEKTENSLLLNCMLQRFFFFQKIELIFNLKSYVEKFKIRIPGYYWASSRYY